jgi:modification methylase
MSAKDNAKAQVETQNANNNTTENTNIEGDEKMTDTKNTQIAAEAPNTNPQIVEIPLELLAVPLSHPRRDNNGLESLKDSIKRDGLIEPLTVCKSGDDESYWVVDGTRRLTVLAGLKWKRVPCLIQEFMPLGQIAHVAYTKNTERKSLSPVEIAMHLKSMKEKYNYSLRDLEIKGYGSPATISHRIRLLELPKDVQDKLHGSELTMAQGLALLKLDTKVEQENWAKRIIEEGISASKAEKQIKNYIKKGEKVKPEPKVIRPIVPGVYIKDAADMVETSNESVHLVVTGAPQFELKPDQKPTPSEHWTGIQAVMDEINRVLVPGGVLAISIPDSVTHYGEDKKRIESALNRYQSFLNKHKIYLTDIIHCVAPKAYREKKALKGLSEGLRHTTYNVQSFCSPIYIFRKEGEREPQVDDVVRRSRLAEQDWSDWCSGIWEIEPGKDDGAPDVFPEELPQRLIKMFSFEGDTVLDPFLGSGTTVMVARELNRKGIGYEREHRFEAVIKQKLSSDDKAQTVPTVAEYVNHQLAGIEEVEQASAQAEAAVIADHLEDESEDLRQAA